MLIAAIVDSIENLQLDPPELFIQINKINFCCFFVGHILNNQHVTLT